MRSRGLCWVCFFPLLAGALLPWAGAAPLELEHVLDRLGRIARVYRESALRFECEESIDFHVPERVENRQGHVVLGYLYERASGGRLHDCRTWRRKPTRCVDPLELHVPTYLADSYLWMFLFLPERQSSYSYTPLREERALDRPALVIHFEPRGAVRMGVNDWYGNAWVDRETSQVLRVEAYTPEDWKAKQVLGRLRRGEAQIGTGVVPESVSVQFQSIVTEFGLEKNGLRFVTRVETRGARYAAGNDWKERRTFDVTQEYRRYRFFEVLSTDEIGKILGP